MYPLKFQRRKLSWLSEHPPQLWNYEILMDCSIKCSVACISFPFKIVNFFSVSEDNLNNSVKKFSLLRLKLSEIETACKDDEIRTNNFYFFWEGDEFNEFVLLG